MGEQIESEADWVKVYLGREYEAFFRGEKLPWLGITYPSWLAHNWVYAIWRRTGCKQGWHLWDEVHSLEFGHRIYCDACELEVGMVPVVEEEDKVGL